MNVMDFLTDKTVIFFIANSLYVISYMLTSMLWLRILAIVAAVSTFPYFYYQLEPLWSALFWQSCFLAVNLVNLLILLFSMRKPKFDDFETLAYELKFSDLKPRDVANFFKYSQRLKVADGAILLQDAEPNERLFLIVKGHCKVLKNGSEVTALQAGEFVGELSFVSGHAVSADVISQGETELMYWEHNALKPLFKRQGLYESYLHSLCSADIALKLRRMTAVNAGGA
jgi:hypothetical protein